MQRILMVCLGNICRSPLAEGVLKSKVASKSILVDSAGTAAYHVGNSPDKRSIQIAKTYGIDISEQRARAFSKDDFENFDIIYAMDRSNYNNILRLASSVASKNKVQLLLNESFPGEDREVPDPYYGGKEGFETIYQLIDTACDRIAVKITT